MTRILIAEDEPDIRNLVTLALQFNGFDVVSAANGAEAVELASSNRFDLILLDVRMPRLSGHDACRQLRRIDSTKNVPRVFLSAKGQDAEIEAGLEAGADHYILKPFTTDDLTNQIRQLLAQ